MTFMTKFVIAIFTLCVFAAVSMWIIGGETGKYSTSISIEASPGEIFQYLTESEKIVRWADVVRVDSFSEDESVSRSRVTRDEDNSETVWEDSLLRYSPGENQFKDHAISIRSVDGGNINTYFFQLRMNELYGTNLEYRVTQSARGLDRFLFPFRKDTTKSRITTEITKLKSLIESEVEPVDPSEIPDPAEEAGSSEGESVAGVDPKDEDNVGSGSPVEATATELAPVSKPDGEGVFKSAPATPEKETEKKRDFNSLFGTGGN